MLKTKLKFHFKLTVAVILTLGLSISLQSILAQWQAPTASPPSDNINTPINTGMITQDKTGSLGVGGDLTVLGYMAINTATSSSRLRLLDDVGGPDIYIEGNGVNPELALGNSSNYWSIYSDETNTDELRFWRGGNRMALTDTGTLKIKEICDENGANCVDVSAGMGGGVGGSGDYRTVNSGTVTGLTSGIKYLVSVYGITDDKGTHAATLNPVRVSNCVGTILAQTPAVSINWMDGNAPQTASFVITAPSDGCIRGYVDGNNNARTITVVSLDGGGGGGGASINTGDCQDLSTGIDTNTWTDCPAGYVITGFMAGYGHSSDYNQDHKIRCCKLQ